MRKYVKYFILVLILSCGIAINSVEAASGYTYSHEGKSIHSSVGFSASANSIFDINSSRWKGIDSKKFTSPEDMFLFKEENNRDTIYVVDSKSNILYIFDEDMTLRGGVTKFEIRPEEFIKDGTSQELRQSELAYRKIKTASDGKKSQLLSTEKSWDLFRQAKETPHQNRSEDQRFYINLLDLSGVYRAVRPLRNDQGVIQKGEYEDLIYLSDKGNNQIVIVDANDFHVVQIVTAPEDAVFANKTFAPLKMITDVTGRMFVISEGVYEGIMQMNYDGKFMSYVGVNYAVLSAWEVFKRKISTDVQIANSNAILNTEFKNLTIDKEGFIYAVSRAADTSSGGFNANSMIKRLNPSGKDKLTRNGYFPPAGDLEIITTGIDASVKGPSRFSSVVVNEYGVYTVADAKSGRLFTYDDEGNLLYISAGSGVELNNLNNPVAIRYQGENILVLDKNSKAVIRFEPTDIAKVINRAVQYQYEGKLIESAEEWNSVVRENPNYELAYIGIGKSLMREGRYKEAMAYFKIGFSHNDYSKAYKLHRDTIVKENFPLVMAMAIVLIGGLTALKIYKNKKKPKVKQAEAGDE